MSEEKEVVYKDGIYYCPVCGSKKITINTSAALSKSEDANTGKYIDVLKNKPYRMSNREKAAAYDRATVDGVGCWNYECRKCGWISKTLTEQGAGYGIAEHEAWRNHGADSTF